MPKGKLLQEVEKGPILALKRDCIHILAIAEYVRRSKTALNFLWRITINGTERKPIIKSKISPTDRRRLIWPSCGSEHSVSELLDALRLNVMAHRIKQVIRATLHLRYRMMIQALSLTPAKKEKRLLFAPNHISKGEGSWFKAVFKDEKKFKLDGPDEFATYWNNIRREQHRFSTSHWRWWFAA